MTQAEIESNIEYLLKKEDAFGHFMSAQVKANNEMAALIKNHRDVLNDLKGFVSKLKEGEEGLIEQDLRLLEIINAAKSYLEIQQKSLNAFFNDYTENISRLTNISPTEIVERVENKTTIANEYKTKLFIVRD